MSDPLNQPKRVYLGEFWGTAEIQTPKPEPVSVPTESRPTEPLKFDLIGELAFVKSAEGRDWARAFIQFNRANPLLGMDEDVMTGWFQQAIDRGKAASSSLLPVGRQLEAEGLLREVLADYGVRSGECRTCDQLNGAHLPGYCIIPKIEAFLAEAVLPIGESR